MVGGLLLPVVALLTIPALRRAERGVVVPERPFHVLRSLPGFAQLPRATIENLALCAAEERFEPAQPIRGNGFRAVAAGTIELDGARLGPGECFGESALLRDSAPVAATALTEVATVTISRAAFMARVTAPRRDGARE